MCGIVGYIGSNAKDNALKNLKNLEYRGYDSSGIAFPLADNLFIIKEKGYIDNVVKKSKFYSKDINVCIGHTRWATTGIANSKNAHPHLSNNSRFAVVHNGIIENYKQIKQSLIKKGYKFKSQTDTEVIPNLLEEYSKSSDDLIKIITDTINSLTGSFALAILDKLHPNKIFVTKNNMPLFVTKNNECTALASAVLGLPANSKDYIMLENHDIAILKKDSINIFNNNKIASRKTSKIKSIENSADKHKFKHYMIKEILEEETAVIRTYEHFYSKKYDNITKIKNLFKGITRVHLIACGTAYHSCEIGAKILNSIGYDCSCHIASEFKYNPPSLSDSCLCIFVSQSGETADTLGSLRVAKTKNAQTLAITNVESSSLSHEVNNYILIHAGAEIAVASTKAYVCQCLIFYLIREVLDDKMQKINVKQLKINQILQNYKHYKKIAKIVNNYAKIFFIGRNIDNITAKEGSLKLKEISYIMSESYPAGELKHGTLALIDNTSLSIIISTDAGLKEKLYNTIDEIKSRNGKVLLLSPFDEYKDDKNIDVFIQIPMLKNHDYYSLTSIIPLQIIAYFSSLLKGNNPDKPRNLAKSVTVE